MTEINLLNENAKIYANIADISVEEATEALLQIMKTYECDVNELNEVIDKLNNVQ